MPGTPSTILVTGATGFTGPFVVRELLGRFPGSQVRCLVRPGSQRSRLDGLPVQFVEGDLRDRASAASALAGAETLVNVASLGFDWNEPLFAAIRESHLERGVFVSTTAILTRLAVASRPVRERGEELVRTSGIAWTILRPTMIYGTPEDRNIARLIRFVERSPVVPVIAPDTLQQPVHVEDVAAALAACLATSRTVGRVYNISGLEPLTFESLVRETIRATGRRRCVVRLPFWPMLGIVRAYNAVVPRPQLRVEQLLRLREDKAFDHRAAREDFGFSPRSFSEGVRQEVAQLRRLRSL